MNKNVFRTTPGRVIPKVDTRNNAGGIAYKMSDKHALAQLALTGCFNNTYYVDAGQQATRVIELAKQVDPKFLAKLAIYAREKGYMKDMPAVLTAVLATRDIELFKKVFPRSINNGKMVKNFAHIIRSGTVGRKSFGSAIRNQIRGWFRNRPAHRIFEDSVGGEVSMADLIKMVHPRPDTKEKDALFGYLLDKEYDFEKLPPVVQQFEQFKKGTAKEVPAIPFQFLANTPLAPSVWREIAKNGNWHFLRMNLNTFARHDVYQDSKVVDCIANKLRDPEAIASNRVFPYQLYTTFLNVSGDIPIKIKNALQDAFEVAAKNIPRFENEIVVCPDVSGSMSSPVTGHRKGATSVMRCVDVAAVIAASLLRRNPDTCTVMPFDTSLHQANFNPRDSVPTIAMHLARFGGGGTDVSLPLQRLVNRKEKSTIDAVIYISDNESWVNSESYSRWHTGTMVLWEKLKARQPQAKLICIDLTPNNTVQATDREDILNVGGFSDAVFEIIRAFIAGETSGSHLVKVIESIEV